MCDKNKNTKFLVSDFSMEFEIFAFNIPAKLGMELAATNDAVEFLGHLLPSLLLFVSGKLLLDLNFSLKRDGKRNF